MTATVLAAENVLRVNAGVLDYVLIAVYFVFVLGIGYMARSQISSSLDFFAWAPLRPLQPELAASDEAPATPEA